jgi:hypothetical protein
MTFEQNLSRKIRTRLTALNLTGVSVVVGNDDDELTMPRIVVTATRGGVFVPGHAIYSVDIGIVIRANAWSAASSDKATTGNQSVETIFAAVESSLTGDLTTLGDSTLAVYGAMYTGSVSDLREERTVERRWGFTMVAAPL